MMPTNMLGFLSRKSIRIGNKIKSIADFYVWIIFGAILIVYLLMAWFLQEYINNEYLYYRSYSGTLTKQTIENMLGLQSRYWWVSYVFIPILLFFKVVFTSICISIGTILAVIDFKFKNIFKVAIIAEVVFVIAQIVYLFNLFQNIDTLTFDTASNHLPLSLLSYFGTENIVTWLHYPLQTLNLFEVFYILFISWLLSKQWKLDYVESVNIVLPSYGIGLLLWMILVVFLTLQIS